MTLDINVLNSTYHVFSNIPYSETCMDRIAKSNNSSNGTVVHFMGDEEVMNAWEYIRTKKTNSFKINSSGDIVDHSNDKFYYLGVYRKCFKSVPEFMYMDVAVERAWRISQFSHDFGL